MSKGILTILIGAFSIIGVMAVLAQDNPPVQAEERICQQFYGSQSMGEDERLAYRREMAALKTDDERQQFRREHRKQMQDRAVTQGVTLPAEVPKGPETGRQCEQGTGSAAGKSVDPGVGKSMVTGAARNMGPGSGRTMGKADNRPTFSDFDLDSDGLVAAHEFNKVHAERTAKRAQEGRQMKNLADAPAFADIDSDGDGGLSREEFDAHQDEQRMKMRRR